VEATYLLNIPCVSEDLAIDGLELEGARSKRLRDDVWSSPGRDHGRRMHVLCHEVTDGHNSITQSKQKCYQGVSGEISRGERFFPGELRRDVGRKAKGGVSPPRMTRVLGRWRAGVPDARS
jgi:hypothetical protein